MAMRLGWSRLATCVVLLAWLMLTVHLCADPSEAHDGGALDRMDSHGDHHGQTAVPRSAPDGDCHSEWVGQNPSALGSHAALQILGWPACTSVRGVVAPELTGRIELTHRASDSAPPPLYLLHAALLI